MIPFLKKSIFLFIFACFQILLVFSVFTSFGIITISLYMLFLLFYFWFYKLKITLNFKIGLLWVGLLLFLFISSLFSHSLPLSLDSLVFYTASFCTFVFFRSLSSIELFSKRDFVLTFLLIGLVLSFFFIVFFSFSNLIDFLPPTNIFVAKYGHGHFAAMLLFLIPLSWWFVFTDEHPSFHSKQSILVLFYSLLIFSFGRFAIFLAIIQLPFLYKFASGKQSKKLYIYLASLILFLAFSAVTYFSLDIGKNCLIREFKTQICKPISKETRPEYFKQALFSFKSRPLTGYGPGSFSLITKKYNAVARYNSAYAHNAFLQVFAESGFFAGAFYLLLVVFLFINMISLFKESGRKASLNNFIFLGLISLLANAFIDFDWNLFPTYQMTLILITLVLWDYPKNKIIKNTVFLKQFWTFLIMVLVFLGAMNILTKILIFNGRIESAFKVFPYFFSQSKIFRMEKNFSDDQRRLLYRIYENHGEFILDNIQKSNDIEKKKELYDKLIEISPWSAVNIDYYQILKEAGYYKDLGEVSQGGLELFNRLEEKNVFQSSRRKSEVASYLYEAAKNRIDNNDLETAIDYYDDILPIFYEVENDSDSYSLRHYFFSDTSVWGNYLSDFLFNLYEVDRDMAKEELYKIEKMHNLSKERGYSNQPFIGDDLARISVYLGDDELEKGNLGDSVQMYKMAHNFDKWVFNKTAPKFLSLEADGEKMGFWLRMNDVSGQYFGKHADVVARAHFVLLKDALEKKDADSAVASLNRIIEIAPWIVGELESNELLNAQILANDFIDNNDLVSANKIVEMIFNIGSYDGKMQLGNYYILTGNKELAQESYASCNRFWKELKSIDHVDCLDMLNSINTIDNKVFWKVSEKIINSWIIKESF